MPAEKELARRIILVVGAGRGLGRELAPRVAGEGAQVVSADLSAEAATEPANEITKKLGEGIGVAGSGISRCGPAVGGAADITNREKARNVLKQSVLAYGGVAGLVGSAGVFVPPGSCGRVTHYKIHFIIDVDVCVAVAASVCMCRFFAE